MEEIQGDSGWLKVTFSLAATMTDAVADLIGVLSGVGVEIAPTVGEQTTISGFFSCRRGDDSLIVEKIKPELENLFSLYGEPLPKIQSTWLENEDWQTSWQQFFKPFAIVPGLIIKPSWETYEPAPGEKIIEMDPGMAFGTGQHESTALALLLLQRSFSQMDSGNPSKVLDVGTGTGILAMAAVLFGAEKVTAIDNDPEAVTVARENIDNNTLQAHITVSTTELAQISGTFDILCANIVHDVLTAMASDFKRLLTNGGQLILAGILKGEQEKSMLRTMEEQGFSLLESEQKGEWAGLRLQRI